MSEKDKTEKILEDFNDVFADIFNTLVFKTKYLPEKQLYPGSTESIYKASTENSLEQRRDVLKLYLGNSFQLLSLGIENQSIHDKYMPIRIMGYDYTTYREMIHKKIKLCPVITIVLNFSDKKWCNAKSIHELLKLPKELKDCVADYRIQVYDIAYLDDTVINSFTSDFRLVAKFFKHKRLGLAPAEFFRSQDTIAHAEAFFEFLAVFTKDTRYRQLISVAKNFTVKGEINKLCYFYDTIEQKGIDKGKLLLLRDLISDGTLTLTSAANKLAITVPELEEQLLALESE